MTCCTDGNIHATAGVISVAEAADGSITIEFDDKRGPRIALTKSAGGFFRAVVQVGGLNPQRDASPDERRLGVESLSPPTVKGKTHREVLDATSMAVLASIHSTEGEYPSPGELAMMHLRLTLSMRSALRALGEEL